MVSPEQRDATHTEERLLHLLTADGYPAAAAAWALEQVAALGLETPPEPDGRRRFTDAEYADARSRLDARGLDPQEG